MTMVFVGKLEVVLEKKTGSGKPYLGLKVKDGNGKDFWTNVFDATRFEEIKKLKGEIVSLGYVKKGEFNNFISVEEVSSEEKLDVEKNVVMDSVPGVKYSEMSFKDRLISRQVCLKSASEDLKCLADLIETIEDLKKAKSELFKFSMSLLMD